MLGQKKWGVKNGPIRKNRVLPVSTLQLNSDNSSTQEKQKIVQIIKCLSYQKLIRNTPELVPVTESGYKNG